MKKKDLVVKLINTNPGLLACPICKGLMQANDSHSLNCPRKHGFDVSSSGYINLLTSAVQSDYGAKMLESRYTVCRSGFFDGLISEISNIIVDNASPGNSICTMLDAGCGEGSQLALLCKSLNDKANISTTVIGVDISKEGIKIAARNHAGILWLVADLARLPLADGCADIMLNILSPSNYSEFDRVLKKTGMLIKAVPGEGYLKELRQALYPGEDKERYSNDKVINLFESNYDVVIKRHIQQSFAVPIGLWPHIVAMTPLAWKAEKAEAVMQDAQEMVTLDFNILVGQKRIKGQGSELNA